MLACTDDGLTERIAADISHQQQLSKAPWSDSQEYRGNHQSRPLEKALRALHVPYQLTGEPRFPGEVRYRLRLLVNPDDDAAFLRVANVPAPRVARPAGKTR